MASPSWKTLFVFLSLIVMSSSWTSAQTLSPLPSPAPVSPCTDELERLGYECLALLSIIKFGDVDGMPVFCCRFLAPLSPAQAFNCLVLDISEGYFNYPGRIEIPAT